MKYRIKEHIRKDGTGYFNIQCWGGWFLGWFDMGTKIDGIDCYDNIKDAESEISSIRDRKLIEIKYHYK